MPAKKKVNEEDVLKTLGPFADGLKKTVGQLWKIFIMRYVAKGLSELFVAGVIAWITTDKLYTHHWVYWLCIPLPIVLLFCLDAIQLLINPAYYAMNDVIERIKKERNTGSDVTIYSKS